MARWSGASWSGSGDAVVVPPSDFGRRCALVAHLFRAPVLAASGETVSEEACAGMIEIEDAAAAKMLPRTSFRFSGIRASSKIHCLPPCTHTSHSQPERQRFRR